MIKCLILTGFVISALGCQSSFDLYAKNRGNDFLDMFKAKVGVGIGLHADIEATDMAHLGAGASAIPLTFGINKNSPWLKKYFYPR